MPRNRHFTDDFFLIENNIYQWVVGVVRMVVSQMAARVMALVGQEDVIN
ncbi:MAG: hypothetical protein ACI8ZO_000122 [Flavobacteriales bacterium]|jgi:hypothetical protein